MWPEKIKCSGKFLKIHKTNFACTVWIERFWKPIEIIPKWNCRLWCSNHASAELYDGPGTISTGFAELYAWNWKLWVFIDKNLSIPGPNLTRTRPGPNLDRSGFSNWWLIFQTAMLRLIWNLKWWVEQLNRQSVALKNFSCLNSKFTNMIFFIDCRNLPLEVTLDFHFNSCSNEISAISFCKHTCPARS